MKFKLLALAAICAAIAAAPVFSGCNKTKAFNSELKSLTPDQIVEKVLTGIKTNTLENLELCFSSELHSKKVKEYLKTKADKFEIGKFFINSPDKVKVKASKKEKEKKYEIKGDMALVSLQYDSRKKNTSDKSGVARPGKLERQPANTVILVQENGVWKIRIFEPEFNKLFETAFFDKCLVTVEFTKVAEELFHNKMTDDDTVDLMKISPEQIATHTEFTRDKDDLKSVVEDLNFNACSSVEISNIGLDGKGRPNYRITAKTRNIPECAITADRYSATSPSSFEKCAAKK
jgi:hypothetical protein